MFESLLKGFHQFSSPIKRLHWGHARAFLTCLAGLLLVTGCDGAIETSRGGITASAFNYTPWNVDAVTVRDAYGNVAYAGGGHPGSGEGSFSCCFKLKGDIVDVEWETYERGDQLIIQKRSTRAAIPPLSGEGKGGQSKYLNIHIYPDEHVEIEYTREMLGATRIDIVEIVRWLATQPEFKKYDSSDMLFVVGAVVKEAWEKYKFTDTEDLKQYTYLHLSTSPHFDSMPNISEIIQKTSGMQGAFATASKGIPPSILADLRRNAGPTRHPLLKPEYERKN